MDLKTLALEFDKDLGKVASPDDLQAVETKYFGRKQGLVTDLFKQIKDVSENERKEFGQTLNTLKLGLEQKLFAKKQEFGGDNRHEHVFDYTFDEPKHEWAGSRHPFNIVQKELQDIFVRMGFDVVDSPEIDRSYNNFDALNFPADHPSRDIMDTFYIGGNAEYLLRTHTSNMQNRVLSSRKGKFPIKVMLPGKVFRNEKIDAKHDVFFYQTEGIFVDEGVTLSNLIWILKTILKELFGKEMDIRLRPNFFPFVEPGFEIDMWSEDKDTGKGQWIEMLGAGMIHENVLSMAGIDPKKYTGFAFGLGSRFTMIKYQMADFRSFMTNDIRFLGQFK